MHIKHLCKTILYQSSKQSWLVFFLHLTSKRTFDIIADTEHKFEIWQKQFIVLAVHGLRN